MSEPPVTVRHAVVPTPHASDAGLDLHSPSGPVPDGGLPVVLWVHGGGYVMGSAAMVADLASGITAAGYVVAALEYSLAPAETYPAPVRQASAALTYLREHARELGVDPTRVVLAGDSAGAQIAGQLAAIETGVPVAADIGIAPVLEPGTLRAAVLCCGMFDMRTVASTGFRGLDGFLDAYLGTADWTSDPRLDQLSVTRHVTRDFPATFLAVGDADPFVPQTLELAAALRHAGVAVETDLPTGGLGHEYQLDLRLPHARATLERMVAFLGERTAR